MGLEWICIFCFQFIFQTLDAFPRSSEDFTYYPSFCTSLGRQFEFHNPGHFKWGVTWVDFPDRIHKEPFLCHWRKRTKMSPSSLSIGLLAPMYSVDTREANCCILLLYDLIYLALSQKQIFKSYRSILKNRGPQTCTESWGVKIIVL